MDILNSTENEYNTKLISSIPLFASMNIHEQHLTMEKCTQVSYGAEEIVIEEGDFGDRVYAILQGRVLISKKSITEGQKKVAILTEGDYFGEIAVIRSIKRTARVSTITPCTFLTISAKDFLDIYKFFCKKTTDDIQLVIEKRLAEIKNL